MGKVILIADSGTTKTDWSVVNDYLLAGSIQTKGMNPYFQSCEEIMEEIRTVLIPQLKILLTDNTSKEGDNYCVNSISRVDGISVDEVYFYGAGCVFDKVDIMRDSISSCIKNSEIHVYSDLLAAAHSTCGLEAGIACIMGTGSNSCFYDGQQIIKNVPPLGFILGDEGGGATLGRLLVSDILKEMMPKYLRDAFFERYKLTQAEILNNVYKLPFPNRFLASFSPFLYEFIDVPEIKEIVFKSFISFIKRNVMQYDYEKYTANFVGSVAYHFKDVLVEATETQKVRVGRIFKSPMSELVNYHNIRIL